MESLITVTLAAKELKITRARVQALIRDGRLPAEKIGNFYAIKRADLAKVRVRKPGRPKKGK